MPLINTVSYKCDSLWVFYRIDIRDPFTKQREEAPVNARQDA